MKLLQSALNYFAMLGIRPNKSLKNVNFFMAEFVFIMHDWISWAFIIYEANIFREYTYALFFNINLSVAAVCLTIFAVKRQHVFNMIDFGEELIEKSE